MKLHNLTEREELIFSFAKIKGGLDYSRTFSMVLSFVGLALIFIGIEKNILWGMFFCIAIAFVNYILFLFDLRRIINKIKAKK